MSDGISVDLKELIALQRYARVGSYRLPGRATRSGNHLSSIRGRGMDFAEVRNYQAGDEIRHMEWRVTARTGRPHVKLYQEERERPVVLLVDFNKSMYFGTRISFKSVVAARLAALLAWTVIKQGDRVGGLLFSGTVHQEFNPKNRESGVLPFLAGLSQYTRLESFKDDDLKNCSLSHALLRLRRVIRPGTLIVLLSDFYHLDKDTEQHLNRLCIHNDVLAYLISDPLELAPPRPEQYAITNGRQEVLLDTTLESVRLGYQRYCEERISALNSLFNSLQIPYTQVTSEDDLPWVVRQTFPRRAYA
jgi:uncharacterized protein (DUF58 family)